MGAAESTGIQTSGYEYLKKADKGVYGDAKVYSKRGQRDLEYVIKEKFMEDERTRVKFENYIEENLKHEKIEFFTTREAGVVQNKGNFCGTCASSTKLVVVMDLIERNLKGEIGRRKIQNVRENW
jgi:hypothetical protein